MSAAADYPYFAPPPIGLAHRGGVARPTDAGVENTLLAFARAVELGFRYLETDVHASADGVLVAFHDPRLDRVTDLAGAIADLPWERIREARIGGREPVPTLDQVLDAFPQTRVNIDIKAPGAIGPLWESIQRHAAYDRVCVGSFSQQRLDGFRRLAGTRVATAAAPPGVAALRFLPGWLTTAFHSPAQVLQIPARIQARGRAIDLVTPGLLARAHGLGMHVHVWTVDDPGEMRRLLDLGVDGIVSDRIDLLRDVLAERGAWPQ